MFWIGISEEELQALLYCRRALGVPPETESLCNVLPTLASILDEWLVLERRRDILKN